MSAAHRQVRGVDHRRAPTGRHDLRPTRRSRHLVVRCSTPPAGHRHNDLPAAAIRRGRTLDSRSRGDRTDVADQLLTDGTASHLYRAGPGTAHPADPLRPGVRAEAGALRPGWTRTGSGRRRRVRGRDAGRDRGRPAASVNDSSSPRCVTEPGATTADRGARRPADGTAGHHRRPTGGEATSRIVSGPAPGSTASAPPSATSQQVRT
ncbi:hypothetical protein HBB16_05305 [Pseudonocardia sp. MCCB 268]|nr:hypothetical protein [Pseudonocardia cytotoxica]